MSTVSRDLPAQPHLDVPKQQARELLRQGAKQNQLMLLIASDGGIPGFIELMMMTCLAA